jgi:hypothetical protein
LSICLLRFKTRLLYAPLLHHRRAQEIRISRFNLGKLPTRFQAIFIFLVVICNIFSCTWGIPWGETDVQKLPILRHRTGTLSVVNMVPLMVLASVKNPLIQALEISYDTFNLMHRWSVDWLYCRRLCILLPGWRECYSRKTRGGH